MCWNPGFATATQAAELALHWNFLGARTEPAASNQITCNSRKIVNWLVVVGSGNVRFLCLVFLIKWVNSLLYQYTTHARHNGPDLS
jgi:hypothetical protein